MAEGRLVVLVNGMPAAGKSTLARPLARLLGLPLLSKDVINETHADHLGAAPPAGRTQREWSRALGAAAGETMWELLRDAYAGAVLESSWRADVRPLVVTGLARAGVTDVVEVWCEAPLPLLRERDVARRGERHAFHRPTLVEADWAAAAAYAEPLALGPVRRLDTTGPADVTDVARWCRDAAARPTG